MAVLAAVYQNVLQPEQIVMYWETLGSFNSNYLDRAAREHIADPDQGKWFPKPAHLIGHMKPMIEQEKRQLEHTNQLANRIERKESTPADKKRISEMLKGLMDEI